MTALPDDWHVPPVDPAQDDAREQLAKLKQLPAPKVSTGEIGRLARLTARVADALLTGAALDAADPDLTWARNFGTAQGAGVASDDWFHEITQLRRQGCTCRVQLTPLGEGRFDARHDEHCGYFRTKAFEAEQQREYGRRKVARAEAVLNVPPVPWSVFSGGRK